MDMQDIGMNAKRQRSEDLTSNDKKVRKLSKMSDIEEIRNLQRKYITSTWNDCLSDMISCVPSVMKSKLPIDDDDFEETLNLVTKKLMLNEIELSALAVVLKSINLDSFPQSFYELVLACGIKAKKSIDNNTYYINVFLDELRNESNEFDKIMFSIDFDINIKANSICKMYAKLKKQVPAEDQSDSYDDSENLAKYDSSESDSDSFSSEKSTEDERYIFESLFYQILPVSSQEEYVDSENNNMLSLSQLYNFSEDSILFDDDN